MTTLAIPPKRVRLYRLLWDRWIIVLRILFDLGAGVHPVRWRSVADTLLVDKKTCQKYIAGLVREGHITAAGEGYYMLTQSGFDALLENEQGEFLPSSGEKIPGKNSPLLESVVVVESELNISTITTTESGKNPGEKVSPRPGDAESIGAFHDPDVQAALDHADLLFDGSTVAQGGLDHYLHIEKVLGWLAYCYDKRAGLYGPAGLVRNRLMDPCAPSPSMKYIKNPQAYLPDDYLSAIGRYAQTCERCGQEFRCVDAYQAHWEACITTPMAESESESESDDDFACAPDETITEAIQRNWRDALVNLQGEMPPASYDTWVRDCTPVHYADGVLQVAARNAYARDWLESRLAQQVGQLMGCPVAFIVGVAAETE